MISIFHRHRSSDGNAPIHQPPSVRTQLIECLHLVVLTTFAITQPVFDRMGERPAFFTDMHIDKPALLLLAAFFSLLVPAMVAACVWAVGRFVPQARSASYTIAVYVLFVIIALPVVKRIEFLLPVGLTIGLSLAVAGGVTWAYFEFGRVRSVVTAAMPAVCLFPALLLFHSPMSRFFLAEKPAHVSVGNPVPIIVLVFDELRGTTLVNEHHEIDAERFPHFAELARGATWFRNATTVHPDTQYAVPAILSGNYSKTAWPAGDDARRQNLFSILESTGSYESAIFEPVSRLAPEGPITEGRPATPVLIQAASVMPALSRVFLTHLAPGPLQEQLPEIPRLWFGLHESNHVDRTRRRGVFRYSWGDDRRAQFEHFLECIDDSPKPTLFFLHVLLPHVPWCYLPSGRRYLVESNQWELLNFNAGAGENDSWGTDELFVAQSQQRQLLQLEYADSLLGRLLDHLRQTGLYDRCLLVVTADHGICFKVSESRRAATPSNLADIMSVPLFFKTPGQQSPSVSDRNVESIDILPSITQVMGIKLKLPIDGQSMLDTTLAERPEKTLYSPFSGKLSVPAAAAHRAPVSNDSRERFGPASDPISLFRIGAHPELVGTYLESLPMTDVMPAEIELIRSGTFYSTDPNANVPCYIEGRMGSSPRLESPVRIAVAVNGTIWAVTRTYLLDGLRDYWTAMVPESAYRVGENDVQYFVVTGSAPQLRLTRCVPKFVERAKARTPGDRGQSLRPAAGFKTRG